MSRRFETIDDWLEWQQTIHPLNIDFKLERILRVYKKLNIDNVANKIITIAGTNGKGSTVSFIESILLKNEISVGTFTSPHILKYNERIKINGECIDDNTLLDVFAIIDEARGNDTLTYFEFATLTAFYIFSKSNIDIAVLEVGLGGRLDATNIIDSDVSIITSIGIDHTEYLGNTIDSIALEKAGVMRSFKKCIFAHKKPPAVLYNYAKNKSVNLLVHDNDYQVQRYSDDWKLESKNLVIQNIPNLRMIGDYQYNYAAAAIIALNEIAPQSISDKHKLKQALSETTIAGRFQYLQKSPVIILDVAHNEDASKSLAKNIQCLSPKKINVVLGILKDKDVYSIVEPFSKIVNKWYVGTIDSQRGMNSEEIKFLISTSFKNKFNITTFASISDAYVSAKNELDDMSLLLVYGSFYTVSEVLYQHQNFIREKDAI